jgi:hypothetical protein
MYSPDYTLKEMLWIFHIADVDDQISIPHGHCTDGRKKYTLNPYTGELYLRKRKLDIRLSKKEFKRLWSDEKFCRFVIRAQSIYKGNNPDKPLPDVPKAKVVYKTRATLKIRRKTAQRTKREETNEPETFEVTLWTPINR